MKIPLADWAATRWAPPPSAWTLRRWARDGEIYPPPEKVGKTYYVEQSARRLSAGDQPAGSLVERLKAGA